MLHFTRWKQIAIILTCLLGVALLAAQLLLQGDAGELAALGAQHAAQPRPRPARRRASAAVDGDGGRAQGLARHAARRRPQAAARGQDRLHRLSASPTTPCRCASPSPRTADAALKELRGLVQPIGNSCSAPAGNDIDVTKARGRRDHASRPTEPGLQHRIASAIGAAIETVRRRVDAMGTTEPQIVRQGSDRILVQVPGLQDTAQLKELIGKTARLTLPRGAPDDDGRRGQARRASPAGLQGLSGAATARRAPSCCARRRSCAATSWSTRSRPSTAHQRADHHLPLQQCRRPQVRQLHQGQRRPAVRHRARRQGDLGAGDPRADPRRLRPDQRQLHGRDRQPAGHPAALRRAAGQADDRRGAHGRALARRRLRSRPASSPASSAASPPSS